MLVLPTLHTYLAQLLSPPSIHTALLLTPEGALVSYASHIAEAQGSPCVSVISGGGALPSPTSTSSSKPDTVADAPSPRTKDEIRMAAGLSAEVWAETRGDAEGMVESELGRMLVLAVDDGGGSGEDPLLLLAVNGTLEADWDAMRLKARTLAVFLAPSVNKHRGSMGATAPTSSKSRTRSTATSPGRR